MDRNLYHWVICEASTNAEIRKRFNVHFSHHFHFISFQIKGASLLPHGDDVNIEVSV